MSEDSRIEEAHALFERVLAEAPERRAALLDELCADRPELRERIERLLRLSEGDGFLDRAALRTDGVDPPNESAYAAGRAIGAYRLLRPLGCGGMAEVWLAERSEGGFHQQTALKLIARVRGSLAQRFAMEREILAGLVHPGIARLYDGGVEADGTAYMVMEYVEGEHLVAHARANALDRDERLALFLQICDAVAYAHTHLVVHRDLKPANVLVTAEGQAKLLDFGIAKLQGDGVDAESTRTIYLSPAYAAPEQLTGGAIGTATDVYALGMILFELLAGTLPWPDESRPMAAAVRRMLDEAAPPPSRVAKPDAPVPARALRGDLDAIVGKALRREPEARYPDARALADDVRRHLDHRPVQARAGARAYVARRFLRRHWLPLSMAGLLFVAMAGAIAAIAWQAEKARSEARRAEAVQAFLVRLFKPMSSEEKDPVTARQTTARELLDIGAKRIDIELADAPRSRLTMLRLFGSLYQDLALYPQAQHFREQAASLSRGVSGADSDEHIDDLISVVQSTMDNGQNDSAEKPLAEIGAILDERGDAQTKQRGMYLTTASRVHRADRERSYAEARQAVEILERFPPTSTLSHAWHNIGNAAVRDKKLLDAIEAFTRSVELSRITEGVPNANLPFQYYSLALTQRLLMRYSQAEASARTAFAFAVAVNGEESLDVMHERSILALILVDSDRIKEGLVEAQEAYALVPRVHGAEAYVFVPYGSLILAELRAGELEQAQVHIDDLGERLSAGTLTVKLEDAILNRRIDVAIERGQSAEATRRLDELAAFRKKSKLPAENADNLFRVRLALDDGRFVQARSLIAAFVANGATPLVVAAANLQRDLLSAELELRENHLDGALRLATEAGRQAREGELAPYRKAAASEAVMLEGLARLRAGDAAAARPLLESALATQTDLYLPKSPKIAQAQLALAECELVQGHRDEARKLVDQAAVIEAQHSSLSRRYTEPLQRLRAQLGGTHSSAQ